MDATFFAIHHKLRNQTTTRAYFLSKTGRPILPATSFFRPDARQVFYAIMVAMPRRDGAIIFIDLIGKLDVLRVACEKCGRDGSYRLSGLIELRGRDVSSSIGSMSLPPNVQKGCR